MAELPEHDTLGSAASELHISESALSQALNTIERLAGERDLEIEDEEALRRYYEEKACKGSVRR